MKPNSRTLKLWCDGSVQGLLLYVIHAPNHNVSYDSIEFNVLKPLHRNCVNKIHEILHHLADNRYVTHDNGEQCQHVHCTQTEQ